MAVLRYKKDGVWYEVGGPSGETKTTDAAEHAKLGPELIAAEGWTADGWSGDLADGFQHVAGNTSPLVFAMPSGTAGRRFLISFNSSVAPSTTNLFVRVGGSALFNLYGQADPISVGVLAPEDGNLEFIPESGFVGRITDISVREIVGVFNGCFQVTDSRGSIAFELRAGKVSDQDSQNCENNLFIGRNAGRMNASGYGNAALGSDALESNLSGFWNVAMGYKALKQNTAGSRNIGIGYVALLNNQVGQRNVAIGTHALRELKEGNYNIAIGADSQLGATRGESNISIGGGSLYYNDGGNHNIAIGQMALSGGKATDDNIAIGRGTLQQTSGGNNIAIGREAGKSLVGKNNVILGYQSGGACNIANVIIGVLSGRKLNSSASTNILIGYNNGGNITSGSGNIIIGQDLAGESAWTKRLNIGDLIRGILVGGTDPHMEVNGGLSLPQIPTADPGVAGRVWNDGGTLKISAGG